MDISITVSSYSTRIPCLQTALGCLRKKADGRKDAALQEEGLRRHQTHTDHLIAIASRSGALASHSACMMAFENSITRLTPREVRTSTISYCSGDSSRCRLAKAGVYSSRMPSSACKKKKTITRLTAR